MLLDYERYQVKSKKRKKRKIILVFLLLAALGTGGYFLVSNVFLKTSPLELLAFHSPIEEIEARWAEFVQLSAGADGQDAKPDEKIAVLSDIIQKSEAILKESPLDLHALTYHAYASFYRSRFETTFETRLPFYNQALVSLRRALIVANDELKPQLFYMLGRVYFFKRDYFYDLAERYLEKAIHLGYKGLESCEYLVVINDAWGKPERSIEYLERILENRKSDLYLFRLAENLRKVNRRDEAAQILEGIISGSADQALRRECRFLLGEIAFADGALAAAEKQYRAILEANDRSAEAHFRLALIYEKKGDYVQYRYELRRTLENDPGHSGARSRLR